MGSYAYTLLAFEQILFASYGFEIYIIILFFLYYFSCLMLQGGRTIFAGTANSGVDHIQDNVQFERRQPMPFIDSDNSADMIVFGCSKYILTYDSNLQCKNRFSSSSGTNAQSIGLHKKDNKVYYSDASCSISYVGLDSLEKTIRVPLTAR